MILDWKGCEAGERQERPCSLVHSQQRERNTEAWCNTEK